MGFIDDDHIAVGIANGVKWINDHDVATALPVGSMATAKTLFATGDGQALTAMGGELLVAKPDDPKYLGYELESPQVATNGPNGNLVVGVGVDFAQLDASLTLVAARRHRRFRRTRHVAELAVDRRHGLRRERHERRRNELEIMMVASDGRASVPMRPTPTASRAVRPLRYEPSTHSSRFRSAIPRRSIVGSPISARSKRSRPCSRGKGFQQRELVPVAPALANGAEIVEVSLDERTTVAWTDATTKKQIATMPITSFVTADPAGHVYAWTVDPATTQLVSSVLVAGQEARDPATRRHGDAVAGPEGHARARARSDRRGAVSHRRHAGVEAPTDRRERSGVVRATARSRSSPRPASRGSTPRRAAVIAARCGWKFGLTATPHPQPARVEPICTQLRR